MADSQISRLLVGGLLLGSVIFLGFSLRPSFMIKERLKKD